MNLDVEYSVLYLSTSLFRIFIWCMVYGFSYAILM